MISHDSAPALEHASRHRGPSALPPLERPCRLCAVLRVSMPASAPAQIGHFGVTLWVRSVKVAGMISLAWPVIAEAGLGLAAQPAPRTPALHVHRMPRPGVDRAGRYAPAGLIAEQHRRVREPSGASSGSQCSCASRSSSIGTRPDSKPSPGHSLYRAVGEHGGHEAEATATAVTGRSVPVLPIDYHFRPEADLDLRAENPGLLPVANAGDPIRTASSLGFRPLLHALLRPAANSPGLR